MCNCACVNGGGGAHRFPMPATVASARLYQTQLAGEIHATFDANDGGTNRPKREREREQSMNGFMEEPLSRTFRRTRRRRRSKKLFHLEILNRARARRIITLPAPRLLRCAAATHAGLGPKASK